MENAKKKKKTKLQHTVVNVLLFCLTGNRSRFTKMVYLLSPTYTLYSGRSRNGAWPCVCVSFRPFHVRSQKRFIGISWYLRLPWVMTLGWCTFLWNCEKIQDGRHTTIFTPFWAFLVIVSLYWHVEVSYLIIRDSVQCLSRSKLGSDLWPSYRSGMWPLTFFSCHRVPADSIDRSHLILAHGVLYD